MPCEIGSMEVLRSAEVAVVTGSSRGIGKAIALALGAEGAKVRHVAMRATEVRGQMPLVMRCRRIKFLAAQVVVNFASSEGPAQEVVKQIKELGGDAIAVGADISKKEEIDRCSVMLTTCCRRAWPTTEWIWRPKHGRCACTAG